MFLGLIWFCCLQLLTCAPGNQTMGRGCGVSFWDPPGAVHEVEEIGKLLFTYIGMLQKVGAKEWILEAGICFILSSGGNGLFMFVCKVAFLVLQRVLNTIPETKELRVFFHKIAFWRGRDAALASDPIQVHAGSAALLISY